MHLRAEVGFDLRHRLAIELLQLLLPTQLRGEVPDATVQFSVHLLLLDHDAVEPTLFHKELLVEQVLEFAADQRAIGGLAALLRLLHFHHQL